jgi:hypothetical protein
VSTKNVKYFAKKRQFLFLNTDLLSSPGRAILSQDAAFSVVAFGMCGKPRLGRGSF